MKLIAKELRDLEDLSDDSFEIPVTCLSDQLADFTASRVWMDFRGVLLGNLALVRDGLERADASLEMIYHYRGMAAGLRLALNIPEALLETIQQQMAEIKEQREEEQNG